MSRKGIFVGDKNPSKRPEVREKISKGLTGKKLTDEHRKNLSISHMGNEGYWKGKKRPELSGDKNNFWKGGITKINSKIRGSLEFRNWKRLVMERDNYTCQKCNSKKEIVADHIKPFSIFPELRFDINNGQALCKNCHQLKTSSELKIIWKNQYSKDNV